jgi:serine/threonine protein kinase
VAKPGDVIGGYLIHGPLGAGGNADVWSAARPDEAPIALKVLRKTDPRQEPYRRFQREVAEHKRLATEGFLGILPLLDYELPDAPSKKHPAWLATPIAVRLVDALGPKPALEDVVAAVAVIAETLAQLHASTPPVSHRDVKPDNCFRYNDTWLLGDFGLVETPQADALTVGDKALGPRNFIAPEMITMPDRADGRGADVYSLGKTLWSAVVGNRTPPPGQHGPESPWKNLAEFGVGIRELSTWTA